MLWLTPNVFNLLVHHFADNVGYIDFFIRESDPAYKESDPARACIYASLYD